MPTDLNESTPGSWYAVEPATWHDFNAVRRLGKICFPVDHWPFFDIFTVLALPRVIRLKALVDGQIVGFIAVDVRQREKMAWIATVGVLPVYRRRGIATTLILRCEELLSIPAIRLSVRASNQAAQRLYKGLGYREVNRWPRYYQGGEDAIVMEKRLAFTGGQSRPSSERGGQ